ncbi:sigma 54 modulation/S30EA ribosomal C-terminal domain-containing protein [Alphaproteobacteria bacterium]|nr:sigma 54 modulation/S30EA ribosomal C-terminal domain-containing protein [Alphaproteobacteria bacterium]
MKHKTHGDDTRQDSETEPDSLPVIAQLSYEIELFTVEQAVMKLELSDEPCLLFRNASHLGLNLVYRRNDNTIAWVDPRGNRGET